jgi:hypothetical protein
MRLPGKKHPPATAIALDCLSGYMNGIILALPPYIPKKP